jgi:membrane protein DedA with SNARE-associated domain
MKYYFLIFIGLLIGGESVLLPSIYFVHLNKLNAGLIIAIAFLATMISDAGWYLVGRYFSLNKITKLLRKKLKEDAANRLTENFNKRALFLVFISKFTYGLRIIVQLLCGAERIYFPKYLLVNALGVIAWAGFLFFISDLLRYSSLFSHFTIISINFSFSIILILVTLISMFTRKKITKRWFR